MQRHCGRRPHTRAGQGKFVPKVEGLEVRVLPSGFGPAASLNLGSSSNAVLVTDLTGDDKPDVVAIDSGGGTLTVLPGKGDGTFAAPIQSATGPTPRAVVAGDFN